MGNGYQSGENYNNIGERYGNLDNDGTSGKQDYLRDILIFVRWNLRDM